jgi:hypothetical protein
MEGIHMTTRLWCVGALASCIFLAACSSAPTSGTVTITTQIDFSSEPFHGTFEVTEGSEALGCSRGTFVDTPTAQAIDKLLTCESGDRSGTFTANFNLQDVPGPGDENGRWRIVGATGDFTGLSGAGDFSVVEKTPHSGAETLTGKIEYAS